MMGDPIESDNTAGLQPLARRIAGMGVAGLAERLAALDHELARQQGAGPPMLDLGAARAALARLRELAAGQPPALAASLAAAVEERDAALSALAREVELKVTAERTPDVLAQRLRHLEAAAYKTPQFSLGEEAVPEGALRDALRSFSESFGTAQAAARELLRHELGLEPMPDQTAAAVDPRRHNVVASIVGDDAGRDNTVAAQEAAGWLLGNEVLVRADVIRYSASAAAPGLPSLGSLGDTRLDEGMLGQRATTQD